MTKIRLLYLIVSLLWSQSEIAAQQTYPLQVYVTDGNKEVIESLIKLPPSFDNRNACIQFVNGIIPRLREAGYISASLDSSRFDSLQANVWLFAGKQYEWGGVSINQEQQALLQEAGLDKIFDFSESAMINQVGEAPQKILDYLENNGYPFGKVWLDSFQLLPTGNSENEWKMNARLNIEKGRYYTFDSLSIVGDARISPAFLQYFLDLPTGMPFSKAKMIAVSDRLKELPYVEEVVAPKVIWLGSGSMLELNLRPKKSSQVNVLIGFLPNTDQLLQKKIMITGEANLLLMNALGAGETIGLNWQQLQLRSPRLNVLYQHPYIFQTRFGADFSFDMFRRDSTFLNINFRLGTTYQLSSQQSGKLFIQREQTVLSSFDSNQVKMSKQLPLAADMNTTSLGMAYQFNNTNYRRNPVRGNEFQLMASIGKRTIKKNDVIVKLVDEDDPSYNFDQLYDTVQLNSYQFRLQADAARFFPTGNSNRTTLKVSLQGGWVQAKPLFRNELFQIGGFRLLRGFDEQSLYLSQYAVVSTEFRYLAGTNSYFYTFIDGGWGSDNSRTNSVNDTFLGTGLGLAFETGAGIFNLAWAIGKRSDIPFNLRQSKIHFGFLNYF